MAGLNGFMASLRRLLCSVVQLVAVSTIAAQSPAVEYVSRDPFYDPPKQIPAEPGTVIRSEALTGRQLPAGTRAWRILYSTSFSNGKPATAVATVLTSTRYPAGPRPAIMWIHGTVGLVQHCMPSLWKNPFLGVPALDQAVAAGWVIVATDYATEGRANSPHEFLIGEGEARSGLDSIRAARQMKELTLDRNRTMVWGHSQGGGSALWVGSVASRYAPDIRLTGVAAIAPATYMSRILALQEPPAAALLGWYAADAFSHFYPDIKFEDVVAGTEAQGIVRQVTTLCAQTDTAKVAQLVKKVRGALPIPDVTKGAFGKRIKQNEPSAMVTAPLLVAQGLSDNVVQPSVTDAFVNDRCAAGQNLDYWVVHGATHQSIVFTGSPLGSELFNWTRDRFDGIPQGPGCHARVIMGPIASGSSPQH